MTATASDYGITAGLQESLSLLRATLESTADGVLVVDRKGRFSAYNQRFAELWRLPQAILEGGDDEQALAAVLDQLSDPDQFLAKVRELYEHPDAQCFDTLHFKDGRVFERFSLPQRVGPDIVGRVWSFRDVTARVQAEQASRRLQTQLLQAQKMEAIGQLTGGIAHDFNNMLGVILGYAGLAADTLAAQADPQLTEYLGEIVRSGEKARDLVKKLLTFSRARSASAPDWYDPAALVTETLEMLRPAIPTTLQIIVDLGVGLPAVRIDPVEMQQVLTNLIINASFATREKGRVEVALGRRALAGSACTACHHAVAGDFVALTVSDDGCGITADTMPRIFEPFFTTKAVGQGTGMGLAVVHGIVHATGGHILVESPSGQGARVDLLFPAVPRGEVLPPPASRPEKPASGSRRIMVVDDQVPLARLIARILETHGHLVTVCNDSRVALERFTKAPADFDAVLSDQTMPHLTGGELLSAMRAIRPDLPVIICTGFSHQMDQEIARRHGFDAFLRKPWTRRELLDAVEGLFRTAEEPRCG